MLEKDAFQLYAKFFVVELRKMEPEFQDIEEAVIELWVRWEQLKKEERNQWLLKASKAMQTCKEKYQRKSLKKEDFKKKENILVSKSEEEENLCNFRAVNKNVDRTQKDMTEKQKNIEAVPKQYLNICSLCKAILLSEESFKNHLKEHEQDNNMSPSTEYLCSDIPSLTCSEKERKPPRNIWVKCSYCKDMFEDNLQLKRHLYKRKYCCLQYNAISEPLK